MSKILVGASDDIFLVAKGLYQLDKTTEFFSIYPQTGKALNDIDVPCKNIDDLVTEQIRQSANSAGAFLLSKVIPEIPKATLSLDEPTAKAFAENIPGFIFVNLPGLSLLVHVLGHIKPDCAILHNDVEPVTRVAALWCKYNNVPCLHVPHAVYIDFERGDVGTDIHDVVTASHLAAAGPYQAQWYASRGMKPDNIYMTGIPRFDRLVAPVIDRGRACQILGLDEKKAIVVYFSSWRQDTNLLGCNDGVEESYLNFLKAAKSIPDVQYIIKAHPRGINTQWHLEKAKESGMPCVVTDKYLDIVLVAMNFGLAFGPSNVLFEAAIMNKPIGSVGGFKDEPEVIKTDAAPEHIAQAILQGLTAKIPLTNFVQKYAGAADGLSTRRVIEVLRTILK